MVSKVNSVAAEFRKVSDLQMADTTKRTIQENVAMAQQLHRMSDKTTELMKENERLREKEKDLICHMEIMETHEREITRKNISNQKVGFMYLPRAVTLLLDCGNAERQNKRARNHY